MRLALRGGNKMTRHTLLLPLIAVFAAFAIVLRPGDRVTVNGCTTALELRGNVLWCVTRSATPSLTAAPTGTSVPTATQTPHLTATPIPSYTATATATASATLTAITTQSSTATQMSSATATAPVFLPIILGDSAQDEYQAQTPGDARTYAYNYVELLDRLRAVDLGVWGSYPEPRRTGYARNWARSGGTSASIRYDQAPGAVAQAVPGVIYLMQGGANDLYYGGSPQEAAANLVAAWMQLDAASPGRVIVASTQNYIALDLLPGDLGQTPEQLAAYSAAIDTINVNLKSNVGAAYWDSNAAMSAMLATRRSGDYLIVGGQSISIRTRCNELSCAFVDDVYIHPGTVLSGLIANVWIAELNSRYGVGLSPLTDAEILAQGP